MSTILVYLENSKGTLPKSALVSLGAAQEAKERHGHAKVVAVVFASDGAAKAAEAAAQYGVDEVVFSEAAQFDPYLACVHADALGKVVEEVQPTLILGAATSRGKDLFPRVAQALDAGQSSDTTDFLDGGQFKRPMYAGNVLATVEVTTPKNGRSREIPLSSATVQELRQLKHLKGELVFSNEDGSLTVSDGQHHQQRYRHAELGRGPGQRRPARGRSGRPRGHPRRWCDNHHRGPELRLRQSAAPDHNRACL